MMLQLTDATTKFVETPTVVTFMVCAVIALSVALIWTVKYVVKIQKENSDKHESTANKLIEVVSGNNVMLSTLSSSINQTANVMREVHDTTKQLLIEKRIVDSLQNKS